MRAFLDAHVHFSAANRDRSGLLVFFDLARASLLELTTSAFAVEEATRNIALKRPERTAHCARLAAELAFAPKPSTEHIAIAQATGLPPKDTPILAAALAAEADLLITGDRTHFGPLYGRTIGRLTVHRPTDAPSTILRHARRISGGR
jgi:predicted nucleic acid-binding protein